MQLSSFYILPFDSLDKVMLEFAGTVPHLQTCHACTKVTVSLNCFALMLASLTAVPDLLFLTMHLVQALLVLLLQLRPLLICHLARLKGPFSSGCPHLNCPHLCHL